MKSPNDIAHTVLDQHYGPDSEWAEENSYGEQGFTRAQAETDIDADEIATLIAEAIRSDRRQIANALRTETPVPDIRPYAPTPLHRMIDAYEHFDGDLDGFITAWEHHIAGQDEPCLAVAHGIHEYAHARCTECSRPEPA